MIRLLIARRLPGRPELTQDNYGKGRTPLHRATPLHEGCVEAAEALHAVGADPTVLNKSGKTAFEIARKDAKYFKMRA